ncbi:hypothetical protein ACQI4F_25005 [Mycolicibacterium vaccae]|uniref:hypothetical protein n=1 Tax=Mycolicibacterium vaccae TaxID=1810 RepID=UPI003CE872E0
MSIKDDVKEDLAAAYPGLERADLERVVTLLAQAPATGSGTSTATALEPTLPAVAARLGTLSAAEVPDYLRVLQGAVTTTLQGWKDPSAPGPGIGEIHAFIDSVVN